MQINTRFCRLVNRHGGHVDSQSLSYALRVDVHRRHAHHPLGSNSGAIKPSV
jgi:hypothetical protein